MKIELVKHFMKEQEGSGSPSIEFTVIITVNASEDNEIIKLIE
ncbi:hypothetical protein V1503_08760 [Bacillus sp. SCS-151]